MPSIIQEADMSRQIDNNKMQSEYSELASRGLDRYVIAESSRPSFLEITGIAQRNSATCSGLNAGDYRNLAALLNHSNLSQLKVRNKVPLPPEIMEHFGHMQNHCLMGVFPEISRVWLTIDRNIYVWAFEHGTDVAYYDGLTETIVSVGLVKPKAKVFQNFIKYLLVLTTPVEIVVLGVTFTSNQAGSEYEEMHLVPEPVFMLTTDGVSMMCVKSTASGRIFMGGKDGCLYEIVYQAQSGWFGEHSKKVNHSTSKLSFLVPSFLNAALYDEDPIVRIEIDDSRHILYTLSEKGCIELFDMGHNGLSISRITRLTQGKIVSLALDIVKTLEPNNFKPVISISAVDLSESEYLNLVAVTQAGARLYFSTIHKDITDNIVVDLRPNNLNLVHVRLPPGFTPSASVLKPKQVYSAAYDNETLLMVCSSGAADAEILWCMSRLLPGDASFTEAHSLMPLDGPVWALTSLPSPHVLRNSSALRAKREAWSSTRWVVVSGAGAALIEAGSSPDILRSLLRDCHGPEAQPIKDFFQLQSPEQACACALYVACEDHEPGDQLVSEWAARAFFIHGSQIVHSVIGQNRTAENLLRSPAFSPRQMSTPMTMRVPQSGNQMPQSTQSPYQQSPINHSQIPMSPSNQSFRGPFQAMMSPNQFNQSGQFNKSYNMIQQQMDPNLPMPEFTAKHNGLYMYVGRIVSPIWFAKCVSKSLTPEKKEFLSSNLNGEECAYIVARLRRLSTFLQRASAAPNSDEYTSLMALKQFLVIVIEMLCLWKVLTEHQFHVIAGSLAQEQQNALSSACFRDLFVNGQEVLCALLNSLVSGYLRDNASVDGISQKLRQLCPTLYKQEDATCSKANELLLFAKQQQNPSEREEMLQQALKLCMDVAPNVNLPMVCSKLVSSGFYSGVVQLCVVCARRMDPQDQALHFYKSDQPAQDREGQFVYYRRMGIYREVCSALERLYEDALPKETAATKSFKSRENVPDVVVTDNKSQARKLVIECLSTNDELLHVAVYEWLVSKQLGSELLALGAPPPATLRTYLQTASESASAQTAIPLLDLLWKVLEMCGDHLGAATVLEGLATRPGGGASLSERMSWLSLGVVCVRGARGGAAARRLEEAAEVANIQLAVAHALNALPRPPPVQHMQRLHDELLEITQLYEDYADRYNLWECKLAIVQCSGHNDALLVENIWSNIISEAEHAARNLTSPDEILGSVLSKITSLGKEYINTGHCFPLYFIVRQLETMSCKLRANHHLVYKTILNIGVSLEQVLDIYIKLVSVNERIWLASGDEIHLARVCGYLLETVREDVVSMQPHARRRVLARSKDLHEAALCALQARPNTQLLVDKLATAQAHLDRLE